MKMIKFVLLSVFFFISLNSHAGKMSFDAFYDMAQTLNRSEMLKIIYEDLDKEPDEGGVEAGNTPNTDKYMISSGIEAGGNFLSIELPCEDR